MIAIPYRLIFIFLISFETFFYLTLSDPKKIPITDVPWTVTVSIGKRICGGSILRNTFVVTAAQCVYK